MEKRYNIYYTGQVLEGQDPAVVRNNLARLFKASEETLDKLFSGKAQLLKRDCDEAKAQQYMKAMEAAGAVAIVRSEEPEQTSPAVETAQDRPQTAAEKIAALAATHEDTRYRGEAESAATEPPVDSATLEGDLGLEPAGTEVLKEHERTQPVETEVDTSALAVDEAAERLSDEPPPPPPAPDTDHLAMGNAGETIPNLPSDAVPLDPDTSALDLSPSGTDFSDCAGPDPVAPDIDLSALDLAPSGSDVLDEQYRNKAQPEAPSTDHLSVEE